MVLRFLSPNSVAGLALPGSVYDEPSRATHKVNPAFVEPIKALIEEEPSIGYRTVAHLLGFNKNTVQRIFQLKSWQVRKRPIGHRRRIEALPSVAKAPDQRWATDLCRVWGGRDEWLSLALVIDCYTRELLGWQLSRSGKASTASAALEQALIARNGSLGAVKSPFPLRSDKGLVLPASHSDNSSEAMVLNRSSLRRTARRKSGSSNASFGL